MSLSFRPLGREATTRLVRMMRLPPSKYPTRPLCYAIMKMPKPRGAERSRDVDMTDPGKPGPRSRRPIWCGRGDCSISGSNRCQREPADLTLAGVSTAKRKTKIAKTSLGLYPRARQFRPTRRDRPNTYRRLRSNGLAQRRMSGSLGRARRKRAKSYGLAQLRTNVASRGSR